MTIDIDTINLTSKEFWKSGDRHAAFKALRNDRPVSWHEFEDGPEKGMKGFWAVTRYDDIISVSSDAKTFINGESTYIGDQTRQEAREEGWLLNMDAPEHFKLRQVVSKAFSPQNIQKMHDIAARYADEMVEAVRDRGTCDFAVDVAQPFPVQVVCDFLGAPKENRARLHQLTVTALAGDADEAGGLAAIPGAFKEMNEYGTYLAREKRKNPGDDIISLILGAEVDGRKLTDEEVGMFFQVLVSAGMETTGTAGGQLIRTLMQNPDQMALWASDPDAHGAKGVEEIVRYISPIMHMRRTAVADTVIAEQAIKAGDKVVMWYISGNHDERKFTDPSKFDITRSPNPHIGFGGGGRHTCLGAHLARLELPLLAKSVFEKLKDIEPAGPAVTIPSRFVNGLASLPISYKGA